MLSSTSKFCFIEFGGFYFNGSFLKFLMYIHINFFDNCVSLDKLGYAVIKISVPENSALYLINVTVPLYVH